MRGHPGHLGRGHESDQLGGPFLAPQSTRQPCRAGAADVDNFGACAARVWNNQHVVAINNQNHPTVTGMYPPPLPPLHRPPVPTTDAQEFYLPGDVCKTIRCAAKNTGCGASADSIDSFIDLVSLNIAEINADLQSLFNLVFQGRVPEVVQCYLTDTYLFCFEKDPDDPTKLRPIGIPSALRRLAGKHINAVFTTRYAMDLLPFNVAIGVPGGMDFAIKSMQLSIEKFIQEPQRDGHLPLRAAVFLDLVNMFNSISREEMMHFIATQYPKLLPLAQMLYSTPNMSTTGGKMAPGA